MPAAVPIVTGEEKAIMVAEIPEELRNADHDQVVNIEAHNLCVLRHVATYRFKSQHNESQKNRRHLDPKIFIGDASNGRPLLVES